MLPFMVSPNFRLSEWTRLWWIVSLFACGKLALAFDYSIVLDCGSRGTRLHIFRSGVLKGNGNGGSSGRNGTSLAHSALEDLLPQSRKIVPGLASFVANPKEAVQYLLPLLAAAADIIPPTAHGAFSAAPADLVGKRRPPSTEVFILCTGGVRLLTQVFQPTEICALEFSFLIQSR